MNSGGGIFWLKVSNIPRGVKLREMWDTLTGFTPIDLILVEDPLPNLGRDCFIQVSDPHACKILISASKQDQIEISKHLLHIRESENPETIILKARDRQKPSQRRIFISHVPRSTRLEEMKSSIVNMAGTCESVKEVRLHPSECPVEHNNHEFQVVTVLFTNCTQVEELLSGKLDILEHPLLANCKFTKFLALRIEQNNTKLTSHQPKHVAETRLLSNSATVERLFGASGSLSLGKYQHLAHGPQMRIDANDHYHRLKPTSSKYFASVSKRTTASGFPGLREQPQLYCFNLNLPKRH